MPLGMERYDIRSDYDVVTGRQQARELSRQIGFAVTDQTRIATAVSEVAHWSLPYRGSIYFSVCRAGSNRGLECTCLVEVSFEQAAAAVEELASLGARRLMSSFVVEQRKAGVVALVMRKWLAPAEPFERSAHLV